MAINDSGHALFPFLFASHPIMEIQYLRNVGIDSLVSRQVECKYLQWNYVLKYAEVLVVNKSVQVLNVTVREISNQVLMRCPFMHEVPQSYCSALKSAFLSQVNDLDRFIN